jgi:hypothetical protein
LLKKCLGPVAEHPDLEDAAVQNHFAAGESALANFITDALVARCRAADIPVDLAFIDASTVRRGLPAGREATMGEWFGLMPHADTVHLYRFTASQLAALLDDNAQRIDRPGTPHLARGFLHFSQQVRYTIDMGKDRGTAHLLEATLDGQPLEEQQERIFLAASTSFVRQSAEPWERHVAANSDLPPLTVLPAPHVETDLFVRDAMVAHIREHGGITEAAGARRDGRLQVVAGDIHWHC